MTTERNSKITNLGEFSGNSQSDLVLGLRGSGRKNDVVVGVVVRTVGWSLTHSIKMGDQIRNGKKGKEKNWGIAASRS